ncbi:MAG TPA: C1 family peptidase [Rhodocyclaceae bacterium]|nr:C1 family peptidase [Rhodocyclaceae bacterium]HNA87415.1 C1 family peptidase [Nitrospira sp.]HNI20656.1 C1 family peptidase [Nitrospira sp.]
MSISSQSHKIRINRVPASAEFLPRKADREGRLGFGWTGKKPYAPFYPGAYAPSGTHHGPPYGTDGGTLTSSDEGGNNGPYGSTNYGPYGSFTKVVGFGYQPDLPDLRDFLIDRQCQLDPRLKPVLEDVVKLIQAGNVGGETNGKKSRSAAKTAPPSFLLNQAGKLPERCDLRATGHLSPVEDQGPIGACTAHAVVGLIEYLMRAGGGNGQDMSRLFLYKLSRRLLGWQGDTGAYIRTAIKSVALFGLPPENDWPYDVRRFDEEPLAYHFAYAQNFKATTYARLDGHGSGDATLDAVKRCLLDGFPVAFGFPVYSCIDAVGIGGRFVIPFPAALDSLRGGHAVLAVGYDDSIETPLGAGAKGRGALLFRNSWGADWGVAGYAYLPYEYVQKLLALDFWTVFNKDWIKLEVFE